MNTPEEIGKLREENRRLKEEVKRLKKIEEEYEDHKRQCALVHPLLPAFVKEDRPVRRFNRLGAPLGHPGYFRPLPKHVERVITLPVQQCPTCDGKLSGIQETRSRIIEDLPPTPPPEITKYVIERRYCANCHALVEADFPHALSGARFGLRVMLYVAFLKIGLALPEQKVVNLLKMHHSFIICQSEVVSILDQLRKAFGKHYLEIEQKIKEAAVKGGDETGWRIDGVNHWLWALVNEEVAWYKVNRRRSYKVIQPVLQDQAGKILVRDRLTTYDHLATENGSAQQICWAHILRDSKRLAERYDEAKTVHRRLKGIFKKAKGFASQGTPGDVDKLLARIDNLGNLRFSFKSIRTFRNSICRKHRDNLFHFVTNAMVPATNNGTERAIRKAVIIRKISNGSRSEKGARFLETLLSVIETIKLQKKNPLEEMSRMLTSRA